jgi:DNA-directed RNA polymerase sigma subunit (sigma70/sigma32)
MLKEKIDEVLKSLTYREREIIKLRYGLGDGYKYTLEELSRIFKVTRERVRQIEARAFRKLKDPSVAGGSRASAKAPTDHTATPAAPDRPRHTVLVVYCTP